jgi:lysozyme family protein
LGENRNKNYQSVLLFSKKIHHKVPQKSNTPFYTIPYVYNLNWSLNAVLLLRKKVDVSHTHILIPKGGKMLTI